MDDALQRRLDRLTVLGVGPLVAVVSLGLTTAGEESLVSLVSVLAVAGVAAVLLSSATDWLPARPVAAAAFGTKTTMPLAAHGTA
ncbi:MULTISPECIES: hypothetical protein [Halobacterium]|nr:MULTISPECIES: hypothetical protein [Halobacterium]MCF2239620.1 hypothetical protein [Halobacterium salinarum]QRY22249.1 hypothetical protein JT689_09490 [Halobacterium sp. GSL-19]WJK63621.1 hypothetical protein QSJ49_10510 [Halobacterium salinarum]